MSPALTLLHACDRVDISFAFIKSHKNPPKHLRNDIFARLSQGALHDLDEADTTAVEELAAIAKRAEVDPVTPQIKENCKKARDELGERLLGHYMEILGRPGSVLSKASCTFACKHSFR